MLSSVDVILSALNAFGRKMGVTANNIANVESEGFKKSRAILKEGPNGGIQVEISRIDSPGHIVNDVKDGRLSEKELSNVDLSEEIPQTVLAQKGYEASLKMIETQDEMLGTVIDITG